MTRTETGLVRCSVIVALVTAHVGAAVAQEPWRPYGFGEHDRFKYSVKHTERGEETSGHYHLQVEPAGGGQLKLSVDGQVGTSQCSASVTVPSGDAVPQQMMMSCMMLMPVIAALYTPVWAMFMGQSWTIGNRWSMGASSFSMERECSHAGQSGILALMKEDGETRFSACVAQGVALPLAVVTKDKRGNGMEITLEEYSH